MRGQTRCLLSAQKTPWNCVGTVSFDMHEPRAEERSSGQHAGQQSREKRCCLGVLRHGGRGEQMWSLKVSRQGRVIAGVSPGHWERLLCDGHKTYTHISEGEPGLCCITVQIRTVFSIVCCRCKCCWWSHQEQHCWLSCRLTLPVAVQWPTW